MTGKIDFYFRNRGFGFISCSESGQRVSHYFHISAVVQGEPVEDAPVEFELGTQAYKPGKTAPAINVKVGAL